MAFYRAALTTAFCFGSYQLIRWWLSDDPAEELATQAITSMDGYEDGEVDSRQPTIVMNAVVHVKCKIGTPRDNKANRLIVAALVREFYDSIKDMRQCDKLKFSPMAVEMSFVPTAGEVLAARVRKTRAIAERKALAPPMGQ